MKYYYVTAETRDGENEYLHKGAFRARSMDGAMKQAYCYFKYPDEGRERITCVDGAQEIPKEHYDILKLYI
jgi:hypothetical protein